MPVASEKLHDNHAKFLMETTIHGVRYLHPSQHYTFRVAWLVIVLLSIFFIFNVMMNSIREAEENPIATTIAAEHYSNVAQVIFHPEAQSADLKWFFENLLNGFAFDCTLHEGEDRANCGNCANFFYRSFGSRINKRLATYFKRHMMGMDIFNFPRETCALSSMGRTAFLQFLETNDTEEEELATLSQNLVTAWAQDLDWNAYLERFYQENHTLESVSNDVCMRNWQKPILERWRRACYLNQYQKKTIVTISVANEHVPVITKSKRNILASQLAALGGIAGLFTGMSLMSCAEIVIHALKITYNYVSNYILKSH